jgi:nucleotide-binding universal stress UspA family protein
MERFKNILVVVDEKTENRAVIERAVTLAQRNRARLRVINIAKALPRPTAMAEVDEALLEIDIVEAWPPDAGRPPVPVALGDRQEAGMPVPEAAVMIRERIVDEESQLLERWVDFAGGRGVAVDGRMLYGTPFLEIIREVLRNEHDLVMVAAEVSGGLKERLFGSTAMHLMRKCPCPVWVVRPREPEGYTRILAAVDPMPEEVQDSLNIKIMDLATALARRQQWELVVVHTWTFPAEQSLRTGYRVASSDLERWVRRARELHRRRLAELLQPYPLDELRSEVYMLKGEPGHWIPRLAAKMEVGTIVMGTVSRAGVAGLLMGNTAERILRQVNCSVLTVKPDGFVTPVALDA